MLYSALLSGDNTLVEQGAEIALNTPEEYIARFPTTDRYYYMKALAATILDTGEQQQFLSGLNDTLTDLDGSKASFFEALWSVLAGIDNQNADQVQAGIEQMLDWHEDQVNPGSTKSKDLVCRQAAALLVVARRKGLDVHVESEYVPKCV